MVRMDGEKEKHRTDARQNKEYGPEVSEREFASPQEQAPADKADQCADNIGGSKTVHHVGKEVNEKDSGKETGEVVVPLHGFPPLQLQFCGVFL
jgi:hypothetical protein